MVLDMMVPEAQILKSPSTAIRYVLVVEYDGTNYFGMQLQSNQPTIQSEMEKALQALTGEAIRIAASSRTDTGVHAFGQVVSFITHNHLPAEAFIHGLNYHLPADIAVKEAHTVALDFDPRRHAGSREYIYTYLYSRTRSPLATRYAHRINVELNTDLMNAACRRLLGKQDLASFASDIGDEPDKSTVRQIYQAGVTREDNRIIFTIEANAFLRHQVRNTAGVLTQIGSGKMSLEEFETIIKARKPGLAGPTLPACGLALVKINYPLTFEEMK